MNSMLLAFAALEPRLATDCRLLSLRRHERAVRIGVHDFERSGPQRLWLDVALCVRRERAAAARDDIPDTPNHRFNREPLGDAVLVAVLARPGVQAARGATRKPDVSPDSASVGVERVAVNPW